MYLYGLFQLAFGVALIAHANLGVQPTQIPNYVLSLATGLTFGTWVFLTLVFYTVLQIPILGKEFRWFQFSQIIIAFFFGYFVDFWVFALHHISLPNYFAQLLALCLGIIAIASGILLYMSAKLINLPVDALVAAISEKFMGGRFARARLFADATLLTTGLLLSLVFLGGVYGIREGTVIAALCIGRCMPYARRVLSPVLNKIGIEMY